MPKLFQRRRDPVTRAWGELVKVIGTTEIYRADDGTYFKRVTGKAGCGENLWRPYRWPIAERQDNQPRRSDAASEAVQFRPESI